MCLALPTARNTREIGKKLWPGVGVVGQGDSGAGGKRQMPLCRRTIKGSANCRVRAALIWSQLWGTLPSPPFSSCLDFT